MFCFIELYLHPELSLQFSDLKGKILKKLVPVIAILGYLEAQKSQIFRGSSPYPAGGGGLQRPQLFLLASLVSLALKTADSIEISYFDPWIYKVYKFIISCSYIILMFSLFIVSDIISLVLVPIIPDNNMDRDYDDK